MHITNRLNTFLLSLLTPGLGYLHNSDKKSFYKTIIFFYGLLFNGVIFRLVISCWGLYSIGIALVVIYIFSIVDSTNKNINSKVRVPGILKACVITAFILITGLSFANRRAVMGFDILSMNVSVMQPAVLQDEKFLIDTWIYKNNLPERGDIITHSFKKQQGLYLNRIIAIGKDRIEIKNGFVILNGRILGEPYILYTNVTKLQSRSMKAFVVPEGNYFVMGDNRDASFGDSRFNGTITTGNILGKATDVVYSQDKRRIGISLKKKLQHLKYKKRQ